MASRIDKIAIEEVSTPKRQRRSRFGVLFVAAIAVKILCMVFAGVVLALIKDYHNSYMIAVIIAVASCTFIYVAVSVIMATCVAWVCSPEDRNCHFLEAFASLLLFCGWLLSAGISADISLRAGTRTTELFAWIGACCGLTTVLFVVLSVMFGLRVLRFALSDADAEKQLSAIG